jgi:hypothetical protein
LWGLAHHALWGLAHHALWGLAHHALWGRAHHALWGLAHHALWGLAHHALWGLAHHALHRTSSLQPPVTAAIIKTSTHFQSINTLPERFPQPLCAAAFFALLLPLPPCTEDTKGLVGPNSSWKHVQFTKVRLLSQLFGLKPWYCSLPEAHDICQGPPSNALLTPPARAAVSYGRRLMRAMAGSLWGKK